MSATVVKELYVFVLTAVFLSSCAQAPKPPSQYSVQYKIVSSRENPCENNTAFGQSFVSSTSKFIVGGEVVNQGDLVTRSTVKVFTGGGFCTGTLVSSDLVVTAAHCFDGISTTNPGSASIGFGVKGELDNAISVESIMMHPGYQGIRVDDSNEYVPESLHDVALLKLTGTLPSGYFPVTIARNASEFGRSSEVIVAGYGKYFSDDSEERDLTSVNTSIKNLNSYREIQINFDRKGACNGDSGGPTFIKSESESCLKLIGSTTGPGRNSNYNCEQGGGTMMNLSRYRGWFKCSARELGSSLSYLDSDMSTLECNQNSIVRFGNTPARFVHHRSTP